MDSGRGQSGDAGIDPIPSRGTASRFQGEQAFELALHEARTRLRRATIESPAKEARLLLAHALGVGQEDILAGRVRLDEAVLGRFDALLARRLAREPMAYITGEREFWSLSFNVGPGVLIPRPESETLIEIALKQFPEPDARLRVLDLGTGSGCLLLAFLSERREAQGLGIDSSEKALTYADRNACTLGLSARARFIAAEWEDVSGLFDVVLANPPYIRTEDIAHLQAEVSGYEPHAALDGGDDGMSAYQRIARVLPQFLSPQGRAFVEFGQGQAESVTALFVAHGLHLEEIVNDLSGIPRSLAVSAAAGEPHVKRKKELAKETRSG